MGALDDFLASFGVTPEQVERAEADGSLELLVLERVLEPATPLYDLDTLAARAQLEPTVLRQLWRAMGFPDPPADELVATQQDLDILSEVHDRISDPTEIERSLVQLRVFSSSLARMAEATADDVAFRIEEARAAGLSDRDVTEGILGRVDLITAQHLLTHLYRIQLLAAFRRRLSSAHPAALEQELAVGFVDLVDFTAVSQELEPDELASMVAEFESRAQGTIAEAGARQVKNIGDEVMFSAESPAVAVQIALRLTGDERRGPLTPDVRAGVACGSVVARWGDLYGPVVNLASRLVNIAYPGSVMVSAEVHAALADEPGLAWRPLRARRLKGIGRVPSWVVRRA